MLECLDFSFDVGELFLKRADFRIWVLSEEGRQEEMIEILT